MSHLPDLSQILEVISFLNRHSQAELSSEALLEMALPAVHGLVPGASAVHVYGCRGEQLFLWQSTEETLPVGKVIHPPSPTAYHAALRTGQSTLDSEAGLAIFPLMSHEAAYALLVLETESPSEILSALLLPVAQQLSLHLENRLLMEMMQHLAVAANELANSRSFAEIAGILARLMLYTGQYVTLHLVDYAEDGAVRGFIPIATADRQKTSSADTFAYIPGDTFRYILDELANTHEGILIEDITQDKRVSEDLFRWLDTLKIKSVYWLPMHSEDQLFGFISINDTLGPIHLTRAEKNAYRSLAEQVSMVVYNQKKTEESSRLLTLAGKLVETNHQILRADTDLEMARIALSSLPEIIDYLSIVRYDRPLERGDLPLEITTSAAAFRDSVVDPEIVEYPDITQPELVDALKPLYDNVILSIPDLPTFQSRMTPRSVAYTVERGIRSVLVLGLRTQDTLHGLIVLGSHHPLSADGTIEQNLRIIADQLAVAIENRTLLRRTEEALEETRILSDVSRDLLESHDMVDILLTLQRHVAADADRITLIEAIYDEAEYLTEIYTRYTLVGSDVSEVSIPNHPLLTETDLRRLQEYWEGLGPSVEMVGDVDQTPEDFPRRRVLVERNIKSLIAIPLNEPGNGHQRITILWDKPHSFSAPTRRLFETIQSQVAIVLQSQQLLQGTRVSAAQLGNQVRLLRTMNQFSVMLSSAQDEKLLYKQTAETFLAALDVHHVTIGILHSGGTRAVVTADEPNNGLLGNNIELDHPLIREMFQKRDAVIDTIEADWTTIFQYSGAKSALYLPITDQHEQIIGIISLDIASEEPVNAAMVEIAQTITSQVSVSLQKIRLLAAAQRRTEQLQHIASFTQSIQSSQGLQVVMKQGLSTLSVMLPLDYAGVSLFDEQRHRLYTAAFYQDGKLNLQPTPVLLKDSLIEYAWKTRSTIYSQDRTQLSQMMHPYMESLDAVMAVPMQFGGRVIGVVDIGSRTAYSYNQTDLAVFQQMVNQLAVAIANSQSYEQSQKLAQNKALVNEISTRLQQQLDIESMMEVTANELSRVLGARRARIRLATEVDHEDNEPEAD